VNSRSILFILLSTTFMMAAIILRPAPDVGQHDADKASPAELTQTSQDGVAGKGSDVETGAAEAADSLTEKSGDEETPETQTDIAPDDSAEKIAVDKGAPGLSNSKIEELIAERTPDNALKNAILNAWNYRAPENRSKLTSVGSLDPDSGERYLLTINSRGGTLRRVEVNSRDFKGRLRYRDGDLRYGYVGALELEDSSEGCVVGVVGHGTPAFDATSHTVQGGLAAGDVITSFNEQPVASRYEFELMLAETKSGEEATIGVVRNDSTISFELTLGQKPIELIRPEPSELDHAHTFTESFSLMLKKPYDDWEISRTNINGNDAVEARFVLGEELLTPLDLQGPGILRSRYSIARMSIKSWGTHWSARPERHQKHGGTPTKFLAAIHLRGLPVLETSRHRHPTAPITSLVVTRFSPTPERGRPSQRSLSARLTRRPTRKKASGTGWASIASISTFR